MQNNSGKTPEHALSPSQINKLARTTIENHIEAVWIQGEVGDLYKAASGHAYFSLKDGKSSVKCTFFKHYNYAKVELANGDNLLVFGQATLYEERSTFQIKVERLEKSGTGAMAQAFAQLKVKLEAMGYFDAEKKQNLPQNINSLAIVTSKHSAAITDVLNVIKRRNPLLNIKIYHASVQGEQAIEEIIDALLLADINQHDVILLTRGGGSEEDLWTFNDVSIAQTLFNLQTPSVSAIGHERDSVISDLVADVCAITPSAAAELLTPDISQLKLRLSHDMRLLQDLITRQMDKLNQKVDNNYHLLEKFHPHNRIKMEYQQVLGHYQKLKQTMQQKIQNLTNHNNLQKQYFKQYHFPTIPQKTKVETLNNKMMQQLKQLFKQKHQKLETLSQQLNTLSPLSTISRGYSITLKKNSGKIIRSTTQAKTGEIIATKLIDGEIYSKII